MPRIELVIFAEAFGKRESAIAIRDLKTSITEPLSGGYKLAESFGWEINVGNGADIVGVCGIYQLMESPDHEWPETPNGYVGVSWFAVQKRFRKMSIGSQLLFEAERRAAIIGHTIFAYADRKAKQFYIKRGYSKFSDARFPNVEGTTLLAKRLNAELSHGREPDNQIQNK